MPPRVLIEHYGLLAVIKAVAPHLPELNWLDLGCGDGKILTPATTALSAAIRLKLHYYACDREEQALNAACMAALSAKCGQVVPVHCNIVDFRQSTAPRVFELITIMNAIHENSPWDLPSVLVDCFRSLTPTGVLHVYDRQSLTDHNELAAITWSRQEMQTLFEAFSAAIGIPPESINIDEVQHSTCMSWSTLVNRDALPVSDDQLENHAGTIAAQLSPTIRTLLVAKRDACECALEALTNASPQTKREMDQEQRYLYDYWALTRALRRQP